MARHHFRPRDVRSLVVGPAIGFGFHVMLEIVKYAFDKLQ
jgi:hypothetical protein